MRVFTGSYANCKTGNLVSISGDKGNSINFIGNSYTKLAPKKDFWKKWHNNIGKISEWENNRFYMEQFYKTVLSKLNPKDVMKELETFGKNVILLCYEDNEAFCHRPLVATWLERELQIEVPEISVDENGKIEILKRNLQYVNEFNNVINLLEKEKMKGELEL